MEEESAVKVLSISDLLHRFRPLTGASNLSPCRPIPHFSTPNDKTPQQSDQNPSNTTKFLKPLSYPTLLIGTLTIVPTLSCCSNSSCFKFADDSATVCCDILDLDIRVIGRKIRVLAWNFIPMEPHGGFLEIIRWSLDEFVTDSMSNLNAFRLNCAFPVAYEESSISRYFVYGLVESVSPVTNIPCTAGKHETQNLSGFLARISVCECRLCGSKVRAMRVQDITEEQNKGHNFTKSEIVYFCGSASIWYPVVSRLIGRIILLSGMKKKLVSMGKEESLIMYVTTEKAVLHLLMSPGPSKRAFGGRKSNITEKGECNMYTGSITGIYIQGMVIELDRTVLLLLTDHQLTMPHSLRLGAIVTVRSSHLVNPNYSWTKVRILGSCFRTSIHVSIFSPMESGCYLVLHSQSLLRKFIEPLAFSARLWVLLVVSAFRKKFNGILSEKEILGSKHKEGLVQKYTSSCLALSIFRFRHGVFTEYCQHELCGCNNEVDYNPPKLVVPISNFISQCETTFKELLCARQTESQIVNMNYQDSLLFCGGKSYDQPVRKVLRSEDMNVVLLGYLKISRHSGRLQLVDATSSMDVVIPDLPSVWNINDIYEINNFSVIMEGIPRRLEDLEPLTNEPFSCRNIFNHFQFVGQRRFSSYMYFHLRDAKSKNHPLCPSMDREMLKDLDGGNFHLLWVVHKFPVQQKFPSDEVVSNSSSIYAEAMVLPWKLSVKKDSDSFESHAVNSEERLAFKRCRREEASSTAMLSSGITAAESNVFGHLNCLSSNGQSSYDMSFPHEIPCTIKCRGFSSKSIISSGAFLNYTEADLQGNISCKTATRKLLLEFQSDTFLKYKLLRIGDYCMVRHSNEDMVCTDNASNNVTNDKVVINSNSHMWTVSFSTDEAHPGTGQSCTLSYSNVSEVQPQSSRQVEIPVLTSSDGCPEICLDMCLHLSADHLNLLEVKLKALKEDLIKPTVLIKEFVNRSWSHQLMMNASMQSLVTSSVNLPVGNLLSVQGLVVAFHSSDQNCLAAHLGHKISARQQMFGHGIGTSVCIHVLVDHDTVKIFSSLSKHAYPIGFGPDVKATFHRVLAGRDALILTPASSIEINSIMVVNDKCSNGSNGTTVISAAESTASLTTGPAALISEIMPILDCESIQLNCKVVAIYVLLLEKNNEVLQSHSGIPSVKIPLAGFIIDDGSSSCCCWTDSDRAATLLHLHDGLPLQHRRKRILCKSKNQEAEISYSCRISRMSKILNEHGMIVMKNYGSVSDSSCQELTLSVGSDIVSKSDEEFIKSVILKSCSSNAWKVVGTTMDSKAVKQLEGRLQRLDMMMLPLHNIWASEVSYLDPVKEGRNILQELLKS